MKNEKNNSDYRTGRNITDIEQTFGALLRRPYEYLNGRVYAQLAANGFEDIRPAHSAVFRNIHSQGSRIITLADQAQMTKQSMGALIEYLQERGYVELYKDDTDARAKIVCLTERGILVQQTAMAISREFEEELAGHIGKEEMQQLRDLLTRLYSTLEGAA